MPADLPSRCSVLIVGGGVAGASAAYHLSQAGCQDIVVLDQGVVGEGESSASAAVGHASLRDGDLEAPWGTWRFHESAARGAFLGANSSGSAVYPVPVNAIKMIINLYPLSSRDFVRVHGEAGARRYLRLAFLGLELQKALGRKVLPDPQRQLVCHGSLYVGRDGDRAALRDEFELLETLGARDIEWWDGARVQSTAGADFCCGIWFPHDACIDSAEYAKQMVQQSGNVRCFENCPRAVRYETLSGGRGARTTLADARCIDSDYVVVATGGLDCPAELAGVLSPAWSYLVALAEPAPRSPQSSPASEDGAATFRFTSPYSANFFTWGFTHDWCLTNGFLRCSGEDHFSALKPPRTRERCASLASWVVQQYPYFAASELEHNPRCGVYSETADHTAIVGSARPDSRVCYLLGCNAWGQALLSFAASLVPALTGFAELSPEQADLLRLITVRRFALLPAVAQSRL